MPRRSKIHGAENKPARDLDRRKRYEQVQGGTARQRGYTHHWDVERAAYLILHPLCANCERYGRTTAAQVVDHTTPHKGDMALFWDRSNWQALCVPCHGAKTVWENMPITTRPPCPVYPYPPLLPLP